MTLTSHPPNSSQVKSRREGWWGSHCDGNEIRVCSCSL